MHSLKPEDTLPLDTPAIRMAMAKNAPAQTDAKSRLIARYVERFQLVTRGGLYVDGFAAPQSRNHPEAWTARRVLEINPPRLRTFWLCDIDPKGIDQLRELKEVHDRNPRSRRVFVKEGDFNVLFDEILKSGRIKRRSAVFALLDQRNTECHWSTVQALAAYKGRTRIEILYFLAIGWLHRSLKLSRKPERLAEIDRWWGSDQWLNLKQKTQIDISQIVCARFQAELGYRYANWWPVYLREGSHKKAFCLIHATDHPEAPKLMRRAFQDIYGQKDDSPTDRQRPLFTDDDRFGRGAVDDRQDRPGGARS
jgi:three-Cys-motif partner protein